MRAALLIFLWLWGMPLAAREAVDASPPEKVSVTVYRDPERGPDDAMDADWPQGFALISETRRVTLPVGESTIRFTGVAEGMIAVSAIVTGLPGGTIEKNRNADLLSPAALVNGLLGNRITITRTNPATGVPASESAIIRTRADGGLVLQTGMGFEAVRCAGLPETLTFPAVPPGLSPEPVFTIDTRDESGGTYEVTLSYLAWGFDWQAHYVATLDKGREGKGRRGDVEMRLMSWLTLVNDNGQTFADADLLVVAGTLNIESDFEDLAEPPQADPLRLTCYPLASTSSGSPVEIPLLPAPAPAMLDSAGDQMIVVTGTLRKEALMESAVAMTALEEQLGDLKLYRVPEQVSVNAKGLKQVAFLDKSEVRGRFLYRATCDPWSRMQDGLAGAEILLVTRNDEEHGLGAAMPMGGFTLFEPSSAGELLVAEQALRDYAVGQEIEISLGDSAQVFSECARTVEIEPNEKDGRPWVTMKAVLSNANAAAAWVRVVLGWARDWQIAGVRGLRLKDGQHVVELELPANERRELTFRMRLAE